MEEKRIVFEDGFIVVETTGRDYDFVATIENLSNEDIFIILDDTDENCFDPIEVGADNWIGILATADCWEIIEQFELGNFRILDREQYEEKY